ncbi:hypothetical protein [Nitrospira sp. Nam74]
MKRRGQRVLTELMQGTAVDEMQAQQHRNFFASAAWLSGLARQNSGDRIRR